MPLPKPKFKDICSVGTSASLIDAPGALSFVKSRAFVTKPFIPTGMKVASPQEVTKRPAVTSTYEFSVS